MADAPSARLDAAKESGGAPSWHAYRARKYFTDLDGLRTLAIAGVVWNHAGSGDDHFGLGLGVKLFFVISGFLITTLLLRERDETGVIGLYGFYVRRSLRIFPLYFSVLAIYAVLVLVMEHGTPEGIQFWRNIPAYMTFTANWFVPFDVATRVIFYFAWSLSAQEQFYAVWPAVVRVSRRRWMPPGLMVAAIAVAEVIGWGVRSGRLDASFVPIRILARSPSAIGLGFLAAYVLHSERGFRVIRPLIVQRWAPFLGLGLMLLQAIRPATHDALATLGAILLVLSCAAREDGVLAPLLNHRLVRHVGMVSLGIYLVHMLALNVVRLFVPDGARLTLFALGFPLSIVVASVSYRWFEQPIMGLRRRILRASAVRSARREMPRLVA